MIHFCIGQLWSTNTHAGSRFTTTAPRRLCTPAWLLRSAPGTDREMWKIHEEIREIQSGNSMDFPMKIGLIGEYNRIHNIFSQTHLVPAKDR